MNDEKKRRHKKQMEEIEVASGLTRLWNVVCESDPAFVKEVGFGKRKFTSIDPQYQLHQATKLWGPYGYLWGMKDLKWEIREVGGVQVLFLEAIFFYPPPIGPSHESVEFPILNDCKFQPGQDTLKKLTTNTRSKALSYLGFSADAFMGKWDDAEYRKDMETKFGDQEKLVRQILSAVKSATEGKTIERCRTRLQQLIANETISSPLVANELLEACDEREEQLNESN